MKVSPKILLCFLFLSLTILAQKTEFSTFTIPVALKENANAVIRDYSLTITIEDAKKMIVSQRKVITILNESGNSYAGLYESYDNDTKITELSAVVYDAFGNQIKKIRERDFLDVSAVDGGTLYSDARVKYINYIPISYPYTLVFESEYKTSTTGFIPWWFPVSSYYLSVEKSSYTIKNPTKIPWRQKETNFNGFEIEKINSDSELSYSLKNQPIFKYEHSTLPARDILPMVKVALNKFSLKGVYGEATNWKEFGKWRYDFLKNGNDKLSDAIELKAKALVKGINDPIEKAKIIYQFMQNKTRYISVQEGIGGWEPIPANQVDKVGYGDCKGLTNYTKTLLDAVGVKSHYSVIWAGSEKRDIEKDFFGMQGNHVILNIPNNGNDIWLECTSQTMPFGFLGDFTDDRNVLVVTPEGGIIKRTPSYKNEKSIQKSIAKIQLTKEGHAKAVLQRISEGTQYDGKAYFDRYTAEELIKNYKSNVWDYINNLEVNAANLNNDKDNIVFTEDLELSIKNYASINETEYLFRVNVFNKESYVPKRYRTRNLPLKISRGYKDVDKYTFTIPSTYTIEYLPENREINSKFGTYKISFVRVDESSFTYNKSITINEGVYPKEDYKSYRTFRRKIAKSENLRIALIKKY
ncbi:DUF3857 domain-containing protein [Polaribacter sp. R77954]|uniref:DUF3857 domain-containing protein n=1 Tax=Polaribacter sp. R77954 TaxID=3093870 RepID=UPI0037CB9AA3